MNRRELLSSLGLIGLSGCLRLQNAGSDDTPNQTASPKRSPSDPSTGTTITDEPSPTPASEPPTETDEPTSTADSKESQSATVTASWRQYGFDPANSGFVSDHNGPTETVSEAFRVQTDAATSSSPVVVDGRVYFAAAWASNRLQAHNANSGEPIWTISVDGLNGQHSAYTDGRLFIGTHAGKVFAIDAKAGSFIWQAEINEGIEGSIAVEDGRVYASDLTGRVHAFDAEDGSVNWRADLDGRSLAGPAVVDDTVYAVSMRPTDPDAYPDSTQTYHFFGGYMNKEPVRSIDQMDGAAGSVYALSTNDGSQQWRTDFDDFVVASPAVDDGTVYVGCWDEHLYALSAADGSQDWRHDAGAPISGSASVDAERVYVGTWDQSLLAIGRDGTRQWFFPATNGSKITSKPCVTDNRLYVTIDDGPVVALTKEGRQDWSYSGPVGDFDYSPPVVTDGRLYVCGDTGYREVEGERQDYGGLYSFQ